MNRIEICKKIRKRLEECVSKRIITPSYDNNPKECFSCCAISSFALNKAFELFGYDSNLVYGKFETLKVRQGDHCWVESDDVVYDITSTQFNPEPPTFIPYKPINISKKGMEPYKIIVNPCVVNMDYFNHWPEEQRPTRKIVDELLKVF